MGSGIWQVRIERPDGNWTDWRISGAITTAKRAAEEGAEFQWHRDSPDFSESYKVEVRRLCDPKVECFVVDVESVPDFVARKVEVPNG